MGVTAPAQRPAPFGLRALLTLGRATCGPLSAMTPSSWDTRSGEGVRAGHQPRHHPCQPSIDRRPSGPPLIQGKVRDGICPSCVGTEAVLAKRWPERAGNHDGAERRASVPTALRVSPNLAALWLPDLGELLLLSGFTSCLPVGFHPPPPAVWANSGPGLRSPLLLGVRHAPARIPNALLDVPVDEKAA